MFTPQEMVGNVRKVTHDLDVELAEVTIPLDLHRSVPRACLEAWMRTGNPLFANLACGPCKMVNKQVFRSARRFRGPSVIHGGNRFEHFTFGPSS